MVPRHMNFMFDHTTVVAKDDPELEMFEGLANKGLIQLRVLIMLVVKNLLNMFMIIMKKYLKKLTEG